jgi:hypothetical protein
MNDKSVMIRINESTRESLRMVRAELSQELNSVFMSDDATIRGLIDHWRGLLPVGNPDDEEFDHETVAEPA